MNTLTNFFIFLLILLIVGYSTVTSNDSDAWYAEAVGNETPPLVSTTDGYFMVKGQVDARLNLTDAFLRDISSKNAFNFHIKYAVWRNAIKCPRTLSTYVNHINTIEDTYWNSVDYQYQILKKLKDAHIWITASTAACDKSAFAIRDLNLSYEVCEEAIPVELPANPNVELCKTRLYKVTLHCSPRTSKQCFINGLVGNGTKFVWTVQNGGYLHECI